MRALFIIAASFLCAGALCAAEPEGLRLRDAPTAAGPAITLGDLFENAGDAGRRAVAPAPSPGRITQLSPALVAAAAQAAGLSWTPPADLERIRVSRGASPAAGAAASSAEGAAAAIRRGETVTLTYDGPALRIAMSARAMGDAAVGQRITLLNPTSNRTIEAVVTGPGAASASPAP